MNLREALTQNIMRVRCDSWSNPNAYVRISCPDSKTMRGYLYNRPAQEAHGNKTPQTVTSTSFIHATYVKYTGPLDEADDGNL